MDEAACALSRGPLWGNSRPRLVAATARHANPGVDPLGKFGGSSMEVSDVEVKSDICLPASRRPAPVRAQSAK